MGTIRHLLGIKNLSQKELLSLLHNAEQMLEVSTRSIKKVPTLRGKSVVNLFLEPSTRTRTSFEFAAKRLSADAVNISGSSSSVTKGETLLDTAYTLEAMAPDVVVLRHNASGAAHFLAKHLSATAVVNAGDGTNEHPTQALLDLLALKVRRGGSLEGLTVAFVGDVRHSRVARSGLYAHALLGNRVRLVGPPALVPHELIADAPFGSQVTIHHSLREGLEGADVVICLRMQLERQTGHFVPSLTEYSRQFCVTERVLKDVTNNALILHPGPMNRGIEISTEVADGPRSLIRDQVRCGVAVRMATLLALAQRPGLTASHEDEENSEDQFQARREAAFLRHESEAT